MKRILLAAALALSPATVQSGPLDIFSDIFVFGDSLSDPGNLLNAVLGSPESPVPPFYPNGQITDGDAWATQIGADFASETNFAFGAARAAENDEVRFSVPTPSDPDNEILFDVPDFAYQIELYKLSNRTLGANPLAAVWFGGNDLRDAFTAPDETTANAIVANAVISIVNGVQNLFEEGFSTVAVFGVPNLGLIPEVLARGPDAVAAATGATVAFNGSLLTGLGNLREALAQIPVVADIVYVDTFGLFEEFTAPGSDVFGNIVDPCLPDLVLGLVEDCSDYLFYDTIHPTEKAHALIAERFTETVAPIPLPASAGLLAVGLAGLLVLRRRSAVA